MSEIDDVLRGFLAEQLADTGGSPRIGGLYEPIADLVLRGGKRLRARFVLLGWRGAGAPTTQGAVGAAAVVELLHACALIHDDVMDGSATRRGAPAVHQAFARQHRLGAWHGSGAWYGMSAAITAGDLCLVWADQLFRTCGLSAAAIANARPVYDEMRALTMRGQYLDLLTQASGEPSVDAAIEVARAKTAACTTTGPLRFGGALAGASDELLAGYAAYGDALGIAFQLQDDLLGAFGDPAATGKPSGDDLRDGKRTVLLAEAVARADLAELIGRGTDEAVDELREVLIRSGARAAVEERIRELGRQALGYAANLPLGDEGVRAELTALVAAVTGLPSAPAAAPPRMQEPPRTAA
ncbi:MAG TPA: polyprenyl synthetase family protein [Actinospica sp.]|nr:polyprenyl synthetase family protein [Actinospica sp.]